MLFLFLPPNGKAQALVLLGGEYQSAQTLQPGIHEVTGLQDADGHPATQLFSVRRPVEESNLNWIAPEEAITYFQTTNTKPAAAAISETARWPLALWFAVITALLFLAEGVLAHFLVRRRDSSERRIELKPVF